MDERQAQIRERAGLEESRLNVEFIDWLRKWGTPILMLAAVASGGVWLKNFYERSTKDKVDRAFTELHAASGRGNPNPDALIAVASEFDGVRSVGLLARLEAADAYLKSVARGLKVGAVLATNEQGQPTGELRNADDLLTPADRDEYLSRAAGLYAEVVQRAGRDEARTMLAVNAMYGLAAVHESKGELDEARRWYEQIIERTRGGTYDSHAKVAQRRIAGLDRLRQVPVLPEKAQVPTPPVPEIPAELLQPPAQLPGATPGEPTPGQPAPTEPGEPAPTEPTPTEPGPGR